VATKTQASDNWWSLSRFYKNTFGHLFAKSHFVLSVVFRGFIDKNNVLGCSLWDWAKMDCSFVDHKSSGAALG